MPALERCLVDRSDTYHLLFHRFVRSLGDVYAAGFYTEEIREHGVRVGFRAETLDGRSLVMAHVGIRGPARVGKDGVPCGATAPGDAPDANRRLLAVAA